MNEVNWLAEKSEFLIDTVEHFIDFDDLKTRIIVQAEKNAVEVLGAPQGFKLKFTDEEIWLVIICCMTVKWAIRHNIGPNLLLSQIDEIAKLLYALDAFRRMELIEQGKDPENDPLKDYES